MDGKALQGDDLTNIARLLGLYTRLTQEGKILASIEKMVALPTVRDPKIPPHENKAIIEFGQLVEQMAKDFGLQYRNVDNRIFEVTLPGGHPVVEAPPHADLVDAWRAVAGASLLDALMPWRAPDR